MEAANIKITNKQQFERLVELMVENPQIGRGKPEFGSTKGYVKEKWDEFLLELNSKGPPTRTSQEWQRVWIHFKAKLKKKLANNRQNILTTGGGPSQEISLSHLEESVVHLIRMAQQITPPGHDCGLENIEAPLVPEEATTPVELSAVTPLISRNKRTRTGIEEERIDILKSKAETQNQIKRKIGSIEKTMYKNYKINKELLHLKKKQANEASQLHSLKMECQKLKIAKLKMESNL